MDQAGRIDSNGHLTTCPEHWQKANTDNGGAVQDSAFPCNCGKSLRDDYARKSEPMSQEPMTDAEREQKVADIRKSNYPGWPAEDIRFLLEERDRLQQELKDKEDNHSMIHEGWSNRVKKLEAELAKERERVAYLIS